MARNGDVAKGGLLRACGSRANNKVEKLLLFAREDRNEVWSTERAIVHSFLRRSAWDLLGGSDLCESYLDGGF